MHKTELDFNSQELHLCQTHQIQCHSKVFRSLDPMIISRQIYFLGLTLTFYEFHLFHLENIIEKIFHSSKLGKSEKICR